jgi:ribonuclease P protein component
MNQTFCKDERLCRKILIKKLFAEGEKQYYYPFRYLSLKSELPTAFPVQLLISVPKSLYRHAVDRNRVKRLIREAYRKNKFILYEPLMERHEQMLLCITYTSREILPQAEMTRKIIVLLQRLSDANAEVTQ